jgi:hypothetical protein
MPTFWPEMTLEWAPGDPPNTEAPTWVDITAYLLEWEWQYGRNDESGEFESGQGYVLLKNRNREFDPLNTAGPWYGDIKPRRKFRMTCEWNSVTYPVFFGHARGFPQSYPGELDKQVRVDLADALALLKAVDLEAIGFDRPEERSDERLEALLDAAEIPDSERDIATGTVSVPPTTFVFDLGTAEDHAQQVTASEASPIWVSRSGLMGYA